MRAAWEQYGIRLWHDADLAALDDELWQGMKQAIEVSRRNGGGVT